MCFVTCRGPWIRLWITDRVMESGLQDTQIQNGQGVHLTGKALQGVALGWARPCVVVQSKAKVGCFELS